MATLRAAAAPAEQEGLDPGEFAAALTCFLPPRLRPLFVGTEAVGVEHAGGEGNREAHAPGAQRVVDVPPLGGTLVLFDSVAVPHEVLTVLRGERVALGGWFHEPVQTWPDWYG